MKWQIMVMPARCEEKLKMLTAVPPKDKIAEGRFFFFFDRMITRQRSKCLRSENKAGMCQEGKGMN